MAERLMGAAIAHRAGFAAADVGRTLGADELQALYVLDSVGMQGLGSWLSDAWKNLTGSELSSVTPYIAGAVATGFGGAQVGSAAFNIASQFSQPKKSNEGGGFDLGQALQSIAQAFGSAPTVVPGVPNTPGTSQEWLSLALQSMMGGQQQGGGFVGPPAPPPPQSAAGLSTNQMLMIGGGVLLLAVVLMSR